MEICLLEDEQRWFSEKFQAYFMPENVIVTFSTWVRSCACAEWGRGPVLTASEEMEMTTLGQCRHIWHEMFHATTWNCYGWPGLETPVSFYFWTAACNLKLQLRAPLKDSVCQVKHSLQGVCLERHAAPSARAPAKLWIAPQNNTNRKRISEVSWAWMKVFCLVAFQESDTFSVQHGWRERKGKPNVPDENLRTIPMKSGRLHSLLYSTTEMSHKGSML